MYDGRIQVLAGTMAGTILERPLGIQAITLAGGFAPLADRTIVLRCGGPDAEVRANFLGLVLKDHGSPNLYPPAR